MVSNLGHPLARNRERQKRVEFLVNSGCDIYGARANWERFQLKPWSRRQAPASYKGPCENKYATLAGYHACICLENSSEPLYFTEKLPDAIRAGCVPIYHSHLSVRESFLQGAIWVDPAEYDWDLGATLEAALRLDREEVDQANQQWLATNPNLLTTILLEVYRRLAEILAKKSSGEIALPGPARRLPGPWPM